MKRLVYVLAACMLVGMWGCNEGKKQDRVAEDSLDVDTLLEEDTTVYGRCGEGTMMHTLELVTDHGDTLVLALEDDSVPCVKGGLGVGDRMAVVVQKGESGEIDRALQVVNLTTLLGKWTALDKTFELQDGGVVVSNVSEPKPLTEWKMLNGHLVLSSDTFDIYALGADSLYLENGEGIFIYKRVK